MYLMLNTQICAYTTDPFKMVCEEGQMGGGRQDPCLKSVISMKAILISKESFQISGNKSSCPRQLMGNL